MAMLAWRLVKERHAARAFDGEGARLFGGRWNARGTAVVYLSETLSLAALETFVHLAAEDARLRFAAFRLEIPSDVRVAELAAAALPRGWRSEPPGDDCKALGTAWVEDGQTALLKVPSVIVPHEHNFVLNPHHPDFARLTLGAPESFGFDERMWK